MASDDPPFTTTLQWWIPDSRLTPSRLTAAALPMPIEALA
jgi:hypothetical protein